MNRKKLQDGGGTDLLLKGKVAVVTGSSRGLGRAYAVALAQAGAKVVVNGTAADAVQEVVRQIKKGGGEAVGCVESVASWEGAQRLIQCCLDNFSRIDILVNNAGIARDRTLVNMTEQEWDEVINVHLKGTFACGKFAALAMREQKGGRIINVTSSAGLRGNFGQTNYAAAKAGIVAMTLTWALELGRYGITVNAIRAAARTRMTEPLIQRAVQQARESGKTAASPEEMGFYPPEAAAPLVVFLASDQADWINGQVIAIDGPRLVLWSHPKPGRTAYMFPGWSVDTLLRYFRTTVGTELESFGVTEVIPYFEQKLR
jgi:3-oxoacyl-[acyl-carrier protein] reductase